MKKFFALLLSLIMVLQLSPLTALAETDTTGFTVFKSNTLRSASPTYYTVTFTEYDGTTNKVVVAENETVPANDFPTPQERAGYDFDEWVYGTGNTAFDSETPVTKNLTVTATYTLKENWHIVTFYNRDAEVVETRTVAGGDAIGTLPATIARDGYDDYWAIGAIVSSGQGDAISVTGGRIDENQAVTEDLTIVPDYDIITYTVTFYEEDKTTVVATKTVDAGTSYCLNDIPAVPVKSGYTGKWVYSGGDFDNKVAVNSVAGSDRTLSVRAEYDQNVFTVTYMVTNRSEYS